MAIRIFSKSFTQLFENETISADEKAEQEELKLYYAELFAEKSFAKTEIINTKTVEALDGRYTVYIIQVTLPFAEYLIEKRYNQFMELYKIVERNYKRIGVGKIPFPSRSIFGSFTESTIGHRRQLLSKFLTFLSQIYKEEEIVEFLEFLEIKKRIEMMIRLPAMETASSVKSEGDKPSTDIESVVHYLSLFNKNKRDLCGSFREFETYYFESRPRFSKNAVKKLFYGTEEFQGLVHLCGKCDFHTDSHLTCVAGFNLLIRLLDYEYNRDAELFNYIFASASLRDVMCLYFDRHIQVKRLKSCKMAAIKLLNIFIKHNPNIAINQILLEDETIQEFEAWKASQQTTSIKAESYFKF